MGTVYASNRAWSYTGTESEANASYMWAYFKNKGWSNSAIAGLIGNTTHESYNNPGFHEVGGGGFGIVQWTPASNYTNWARPRGFPIDLDYSNPEKYLQGQCERIIYEVNTGIEFFGNNRYDRNWLSYNNWASYINNTLTPEEAAWLFMSNYERPRYDAAMGSLNARQTYARRWYDMFSSAQVTQRQRTAHLAAQWAIDIANDASHGYDQSYRWGERGDYDCSSLVISAYDQYGLGLKAAGATYTGNMRQVMLNKGFRDVTSEIDLRTGSGLIEGDVLLNYVHHTAMSIGDGKIVQASINEVGGTRNSKPGDQTSREIYTRDYYVYSSGGWNCVLRYDGYTEGFGQSSASGGVSILKAIPVTRPDWMADPERNG